MEDSCSSSTSARPLFARRRVVQSHPQTTRSRNFDRTFSQVEHRGLTWSSNGPPAHAIRRSHLYPQHHRQRHHGISSLTVRVTFDAKTSKQIIIIIISNWLRKLFLSYTNTSKTRFQDSIRQQAHTRTGDTLQRYTPTLEDHPAYRAPLPHRPPN